jgi:hypothetical protein
MDNVATPKGDLVDWDVDDTITSVDGLQLSGGSYAKSPKANGIDGRALLALASGIEGLQTRLLVVNELKQMDIKVGDALIVASALEGLNNRINKGSGGAETERARLLPAQADNFVVKNPITQRSERSSFQRVRLAGQSLADQSTFFSNPALDLDFEEAPATDRRSLAKPRWSVVKPSHTAEANQEAAENWIEVLYESVNSWSGHFRFIGIILFIFVIKAALAWWSAGLKAPFGGKSGIV